jgi:hypothetical protein
MCEDDDGEQARADQLEDCRLRSCLLHPHNRPRKQDGDDHADDHGATQDGIHRQS